MLTILSLCDGTGAWSNPYRDAGYDVIRVALQGSKMHRLPPSPARAVLRSVTPAGVAGRFLRQTNETGVE